ncbi:MAG: cysteine desulfurase family protein [Acidimicrobiales bacterium]
MTATRTYLDHASTSPLRPVAAAAMIERLQESGLGAVGDPSRSHHEGMAARAAVEQAREEVAAAFGARPREVVFCSGATEAIAMASWGAGARTPGARSVLSAVEHSAVRTWAERGPTTVVPVDRGGRVDADDLLAAVDDTTAVVHLQWGNHEVGTTQPVAAVAEECRRRGVLLHVDAAQAAGRVPIAFAESGIDLLSISAHKFGGPAGVGALLVRRGLRLDPLLVGGDQERARRAGMENVASLAGFAAAATVATTHVDAEARRLTELADRVRSWADGAGGVTVLGDPAHRLPHIVCLAIAGIEPQPVLIGLDRAGIAVHSGNSCSSEALEPSPVLAAMGVDAHHSLRVSLGWSTVDDDVDRLLTELPRVLDELRRLRT